MAQGRGLGRITRRRAMAMAAGTAGAAAIGAIGIKPASTAAQADQQAGGAGSGYYGSPQGVEGIVVTGIGQGTGEVTQGVVQYILRYGPDAPQMTESTSSSEFKGEGTIRLRMKMPWRRWSKRSPKPVFPMPTSASSPAATVCMAPSARA